MELLNLALLREFSLYQTSTSYIFRSLEKAEFCDRSYSCIARREGENNAMCQSCKSSVELGLRAARMFEAKFLYRCSKHISFAPLTHRSHEIAHTVQYLMLKDRNVLWKGAVITAMLYSLKDTVAANK